MVHDTGNRILNSLEQKFGKLALPHILRWIAGFQLLSWVLYLFSPEFLQWIAFNRGAIYSGEVWRIITWVFFPITTGRTPISILFMVMMLLFTFYINDSLERAWGTFRLNVYVIATTLILSIVGLMPFLISVSGLQHQILFSAVFLAFATLFPNEIINLFGIIPIKAKWLGWVDVAFLVGTVLIQPAAAGPPIILGMVPYMLVFFPTFFSAAKERRDNSVRQHKFEKSKTPDQEPFHECERCGATDVSDPNLEFRVTSDGKEYCEVCREKIREETE